VVPVSIPTRTNVLNINEAPFIEMLGAAFKFYSGNSKRLEGWYFLL
jgi:hypothetical protein